MDAVHTGELGGTYGVACAAAFGAMECMREQDLTSAARRIGDVMLDRLTKLAERYPAIGDVRGRGAMVAIELAGGDSRTPDAAKTAAISAYCRSPGVLTLTSGTYGNCCGSCRRW